MDILQSDDGKKGKFYVEIAEETLAEMSYVYAGEKTIIIDHTDVNIKLKGMGVGKKLVEKAVEFVRHNGIKVIPLCPFAKSVFDKVKEYQDVL